MRIKDGCEISISGRNKKRILLVGVILSMVTLLTPVSLAAIAPVSLVATAGGSDIKITDQSVNTDKIATLLNTASSALILSILDEEETTSQSVNNYEEPLVDLSNANNVEKEPTKDLSSDKTQGESSSDVTNNYVTNTGLNSNNNIIIDIINKIELNSGSVGPESGNSNDINQVNPIGGTESKPSTGGFRIPYDLKVGDIIIWDAGYRYKNAGIISLVYKDLNGHIGIYGGNYTDENGTVHYQVVDAVPNAGVRIKDITADNYRGEVYVAVKRLRLAVEGNPEERKDAEADAKAAAEWASDQVGAKYQEFWNPIYGARKWYDPKDPNYDISDDRWYCSELVWAAYYSISLNQPPTYCTSTRSNRPIRTATIDIDTDGWEKSILDYLPLLDFRAGVSPLEIMEDDDLTSVYEEWEEEDQSNSCTFTSFSADSNTNSNSNTVSYSDSEDTASNYLNSGSKSNTVTSLSSSLNANTLLSYLLKIPKSH